MYRSDDGQDARGRGSAEDLGGLWVLNLCAEEELATPSATTLSKKKQLEVERQIARLSGLVPPGDLILAPWGRDREESPPRTARGQARRGFAWSPTPSAIRQLSAAGARVPPAPAVDILRRVNHRAFSAGLGQTLEGACFLDSELALADWQRTCGGASTWVAKRAFGFRGGGRRILHTDALKDADIGWIRSAMMRDGGVQMEPWVDRTTDWALHGYLSAEGRLSLGRATNQTCDAAGVWKASTVARLIEATLGAELQREAETTAEALREAGYFGPFGIDAFQYRTARGSLALNPRCEINARYSMGWAIGMGDLRPDLEW